MENTTNLFKAMGETVFGEYDEIRDIVDSHKKKHIGEINMIADTIEELYKLKSEVYKMDIITSDDILDCMLSVFELSGTLFNPDIKYNNYNKMIITDILELIKKYMNLLKEDRRKFFEYYNVHNIKKEEETTSIADTRIRKENPSVAASKVEKLKEELLTMRTDNTNTTPVFVSQKKIVIKDDINAHNVNNNEMNKKVLDFLKVKQDKKLLTKRVHWTSDEDNIIREYILSTTHPMISELSKKLPNRTFSAIYFRTTKTLGFKCKLDIIDIYRIFTYNEITKLMNS